MSDAIGSERVMQAEEARNTLATGVMREVKRRVISLQICVREFSASIRRLAIFALPGKKKSPSPLRVGRF